MEHREISKTSITLKKMKIKRIRLQYSSCFSAILECENCKHEETIWTGYDVANYHNHVIPSFVCQNCGKKSPEDYRPLTTKYPPDFVI